MESILIAGQTSVPNGAEELEWYRSRPDDISSELACYGWQQQLAGLPKSCYDRLIQTAQNALDPATRMQTLHQAEKILIDDAVIAPVFFQTNPVMIRPQVKAVYCDRSWACPISKRPIWKSKSFSTRRAGRPDKVG